MAINRFYLSVLINVVLISISAFVFFYFLTVTHQSTTAAGVGIIAIILTGRLVYHVNRTNRILGNYLLYLKDEDPSLTYTEKYTDRNFRGLNQNLSLLVKEFKEGRIDKEIQSQYLQTIVDNVATGIISMDDQGKVRLTNNAARSLLGVDQIRMIQELDELHAGLGTRIQKLKSWEKLTEKISSGGKLHYLTLNATTIKMKGKSSHIIAMNDIKYQMEEQEIESWRKLIRVITHEIMNSITPITTLTLAIKKKFTSISGQKEIQDLVPADITEALKSADIIEERSKGLVYFIEKYKTLTKLPPLTPTTIDLPGLFGRMNYLFTEQLQQKDIQLEIDTEGLQEIHADKKLMEQVMINLLKNAIEAFDNSPNPHIVVISYRDDEGRDVIEIADNGSGIPQDKLDQVFIPFFTTREYGSGIGLSLCRQIVRLHKGEILIESVQGSGTKVYLKFYTPNKA